MAEALVSYKNLSVAVTLSVKAALSQWIRRVNYKRLLTDALLWCALAVFIILGVMNVGALRSYPLISLRYATPFSGKTAYQARQYSVEHSDDDTFWPTFWHETQAGLAGEYSSAYAVCILFSGDASLVWPARYITGTAPGVTDGAGCAVSSALAWELWGGTDVAGTEVEIGGETRTVRGVFEGDDLLALVSVRDEDTTQSFTAVELSGGPSGIVRSDVRRYASAAGLGTPDNILMGTPVALASALAALPIFILSLYGLGLCIARLRTRPAALRTGMLMALIMFAFFLPGLLDILPGWMIPTRWSDFSFWGELASQVGTDLREYLVLSPTLRDVEYKILLLKQAGIAFLSVGCALSICFRWHSRAAGKHGGRFDTGGRFSCVAGILFKSVLRLLQVVKHPVSDGDYTPPEVIPPKEAGVLTQLAFGKTPTSRRSVGGGYDK